jgi:hypothetical protein
LAIIFNFTYYKQKNYIYQNKKVIDDKVKFKDLFKVKSKNVLFLLYDSIQFKKIKQNYINILRLFFFILTQIIIKR